MLGVVLHAVTAEEALKQWEFVLCHFRPDVIYYVGAEAVPADSKVLRDAVCIQTADELPDPIELVLLAPTTGAMIQGEVSLRDFEHPEHVVYWVGSDNHHLDPQLFDEREPDAKVYIETDSRDQMHAHVAFAVTMWDRRLKER